MSQGFEFLVLKNHILILEFKLNVIPLTCFELKGSDAVTLSHDDYNHLKILYEPLVRVSSESKY